MAMVMNACLLAGLLLILFRNVLHHPYRRWFMLALLMKMAGGLALGLLYRHYYAGGDTMAYYQEAGNMLRWLSEGGSIFNLYFDGPTSGQFLFAGQPRAFFFSKLILPLYYVTGGNYWVMGLYLSVFSFISSAVLVNTICRQYPHLAPAAFVAFLFVPSVVFWTSGLLKESLAYGVICLLWALALRPWTKAALWKWAVLYCVGAWLLWHLKYMYAAVLLPATWIILAGHLWKSVPQKKYWWTAGLLTLCALLMAFLAFTNLEARYNLNPQRLPEALWENYHAMRNASAAHGAANYADLQPTYFSLIYHAPEALYTALFRPMIWEAREWLPRLAGIENVLILSLTVLALYHSRGRLPWHSLLWWAVIVYIVLLAIGLGYASPNFGALSRYKIGYWPFFCFLVLSGMPWLRIRKPDYMPR